MDVYAELGVKKIINAAGTYTMLGGSRMSERTFSAMTLRDAELDAIARRIGAIEKELA